MQTNQSQKCDASLAQPTGDHISYPTDSPTATRLALCSSLSLSQPPLPYQGIISHKIYDLILEIFQKLFPRLFWFCQFNQATNLHMSWQLSCRDMCKIVTWWGHQFLCKGTAYFYKIWVTSSESICEINPIYYYNIKHWETFLTFYVRKAPHSLLGSQNSQCNHGIIVNYSFHKQIKSKI